MNNAKLNNTKLKNAKLMDDLRTLGAALLVGALLTLSIQFAVSHFTPHAPDNDELYEQYENTQQPVGIGQAAPAPVKKAPPAATAGY